MFRPLWIEVDLKALRGNFQTIKNYIGKKVKIVATIKQSAYGHGLIAVARELSQIGVDFFGVGSIDEAISLRYNGFCEPIIILSAIFPSFAEVVLKNNIIVTVSELGLAKKLDKEAAKQETKAIAHVKIDTGMGRLGLYYKDAHKLIKEFKKLKNLSLEGIYTHFPAADTDKDFTNYQIDTFNKFINQLKNEGIHFKYQHCANSLGVAHYPHSHFNIVRPGLILYGIKPSPDTDLKLQPILSLKSKVIFLKRIQKGMGVSYGRTFIAKKSTCIATVAIGYADGYPWALSNCAKVIIKDSFFDLVGRVCMDHVMIDLGNRRDIRAGEEVVLIGRSKNLQITSENISHWAKTIPYEIVSRLSLKIPRVYRNSSNTQMIAE